MSEVQKGQISGAGIWPFAISIILFSLFIDKIGYGRAMVFAFVAHVTYAIVVICAPLVLAAPGASADAVAAGKQTGYWMLYIGNLIFALGNGTVEAVVNPVVATMFSATKPNGSMRCMPVGPVDWSWLDSLPSAWATLPGNGKWE